MYSSLYGTVYVTVRCPSVCPSVSVVDHHSSVRRVCCWAPLGQEVSIDSGGHPAAMAPLQHGAQQHGAQQQMRAVSRLQPPQEAEHVLVAVAPF